MASPETAYENMEPPSQAKQCCKCFSKILGGACGVFVLLAILVQAVLYWWATLHCSARTLKGYSYPGGGDKDLVPADSLLVEQAPRWWGSSFINIPTDKVGQASSASTGVYFRTWGPLWYTYTYQDVLGQETFLVRDRPLAIGGSHKIMRCDGEGPSWVVSEGGHWLMNGIRSLLGMYTSRIYNVWKGNELVAISEKVGGVGQSHKQIIFRAPKKAEPFASCFLKDRHFHGEFDEWFVQIDKNSSLPNFVPNGVSMLMAFATAKEKAKSSPKPSEFLEVAPSASADAVEVTPSASAGAVEAEVVATLKTAAAPAEQSETAADTVDKAQEVEAVVAPAEQATVEAATVGAEQAVSTPSAISEESREPKEESQPAEEHV